MDQLTRDQLRTRMETRLCFPEEIDGWRLPSFQRPLRVNKRVREYAHNLLNEWGGVMKGVITLGKLVDDPTDTTWIVDGQHRLHGFKISGLPECLIDIQTRWFYTKADMAAAFRELNSTLVRQTPDDNLRAMQESHVGLHVIATSCVNVGFGNVRRGGTKHMVSMSVLLRCWAMAGRDAPASATQPVDDLANALSETDVRCIVAFMDIAGQAWGTDREFHRLWGQLNLTLCMWLYRRLVVDRERKGKRREVLNADQFRRCLMRLSSTHLYVDWLAGRSMHERERAPCYLRICDGFVTSLRAEGIAKPVLPKPDWVTGKRT